MFTGHLLFVLQYFQPRDFERTVLRKGQVTASVSVRWRISAAYCGAAANTLSPTVMSARFLENLIAFSLNPCNYIWLVGDRASTSSKQPPSKRSQRTRPKLPMCRLGLAPACSKFLPHDFVLRPVLTNRVGGRP